ncbi:hypothetical protein BO70DRAFT_283688, partial [Aspergillus heteromorphus CBS 117.55]
MAIVSTTTTPLDGITGEIATHGSLFTGTILFFMSISIYNVLELVILILTTFRRWRGLYFWSLLLSGCLGVIPYTLGFLLKFFTSANSTLSVTVLTIGWWVMVTGQAIVLYSRLHLVICDDERVLRWVAWMITLNIFLLHIPTTILTYGSNAYPTSEHIRAKFVLGYNIMEKLQMTGFTVQEIILSGLYVYETVKLLRLCYLPQNQRIMRQLVGINVAMLGMDLVL